MMQLREESYNFFKNLCSQRKIEALSDCWDVLHLLESSDLCYNGIHSFKGYKGNATKIKHN